MILDPIALLEAAYTLGGSERCWLSRLTEGARAGLKDGSAIIGWTYDASGDGLHQIRETSSVGIGPEVIASNAAFDAALPLSVRKAISRIYRTGFVGSLRDAPPALEKVGVDARLARGFEQRLNELLLAQKLEDALWVNAQDPTHLGCLLVAPSSTRRGFAPREIHQWRCVAAHVATAFRIRRRFEAGVASGPAEAKTQEAILRPDGAIEHAEGAASREPARTVLRRAVLSLDRARGSLRRHDPQEALSIWHAMVAGRWSLIDHVDSDGRRFVVAHKNDPSVPDQRGLTLRERQVLAYAALGHSNKVIAYELGLSPSTVAGHLSRARTKASLPSFSAMRVTDHVSKRNENHSTE